MRLLCSMVLAVVISAATVFAEDPIVPIEARGEVDVPSLVMATVPAVPAGDAAAIEQATIEAAKKLDRKVFELLPAADREECDAAVGSTLITGRLSQSRADAIRRCIFETKSARVRLDSLFETTEEFGAAPANPQSIRLEGPNVRFGSIRLDVDALNESLGKPPGRVSMPRAVRSRTASSAKPSTRCAATWS